MFLAMKKASKIKSLETLLSYVQKQLSLSDQENMDNLMNTLSVSELTMNMFDTILMVTNSKEKYEVCLRLTLLLKNHWNLTSIGELY